MKNCSNKGPKKNDLRTNKHVEMGNCRNEGDEEFDISDSEIKEYKEAVHKLLKFRNYKVRAPNGEFRCPFCVGVEEQEYHRLLEHAVRVAEGSTGSEKQRANHSAMAKYLVIDLPDEVEHKTKVANAQPKRALEQQGMLNFDFENKKPCHNSLKEDLDKREVALTEEKKKECWEKEGCSVPNKKDKVAKKDLIKPKRPASAFFVFMEEFRKTFKKQNPNVKRYYVGKAGGAKWISLSQAERAPYMAEAAKLQQEYEKLKTAYNMKQDSSDMSSSDEDSSEEDSSGISSSEEDDTFSSE